MTHSTYRWLAALLLIASVTQLHAKRVVCISADPDDDGFLKIHEGWEWQNKKDDTVIQVGGSLTDCLAQLENGDELVIVAHGNNSGTGFKWNGTVYTGFGEGEGNMPVPDGFGALNNITVDFCTCWSKRDPDGADGGDTSLADKLKDQLGDGATVNGFTDIAEANICISFVSPEGVNVTEAEVKQAEDALNNDQSWGNKPPHNRQPAPENTDLSTAQGIVDAAVGAGKFVVEITYKKPTNKKEEQANAGNTGLENGGTLGCACAEDGNCGLVGYMFDNNDHFSAVESDVSLALQPGAMVSDRPIQLYDFFANDGSFFTIQSIRLANITSSFDAVSALEPLDHEPFVFYDIILMIDNPDDEAGGGSFAGTGSFEAFHGFQAQSDAPGETNWYSNVDIVNFNAQVELPGGTITLTGLGDGAGATAVTQLNDNDRYIVDSFFDIVYRVDFNGATGASSQFVPARHELTSDVSQSGCTNPNASNYNPSAAFDDGSCLAPMAGCTYPQAENYNPLATEDDGSCTNTGCTDPLANNYDAAATNDDGSCSFAVPCPTDLNGDGTRGTGDLLIIIGEFGLDCE